MSDAVLDRLLTSRRHDDVALVAVRVRPLDPADHLALRQRDARRRPAAPDAGDHGPRSVRSGEPFRQSSRSTSRISPWPTPRVLFEM